jgi:ribonuclease R
VHRLIQRYLDKGRSADKVRTEELCRHSSDMEQLAANAERASIKYKQVEFLKDHLGEIYDGTISGVTEWGIYVELTDNMCEGLVPVRDLPDDYFDFDEKNYALVGRRSHVRYTLGDKVRVQVARADLDRKQLDFALVGEDGKAILASRPTPSTSRGARQKPTKKGGKKEKRQKEKKEKSKSRRRR